MKRLGIVLVLLLAVGMIAQQKHAHKSSKATSARHDYTPGDLQWGPPPPFVPPGAQVAVLEGNPMGTTGDYTIRVKAPDGYVIAPHYHPKRENVTIISGAMKFGMGDKFDESKMKSYPAGSFAYMDPSMHHFVKTQGETVVQIHGQAPLAFTYVNPNDDPRNKK